MFVFWILFFGFISVYRMSVFKKIKSRTVFKQSVLAKIVTLTFLFLIIFKTMPFQRGVFFIIAVFILFFFFFLLKALLKYRERKAFEKVFLLFLDQMILFLQNGESFRSAFCSSIVFVQKKHQEKLREIYRRVTFSQQVLHFSGSQFEKRVLSRLIRIDKGTQNSLEPLKNFRSELYLTTLFRHRSVQIAAAARFQCGILTILYISLLSFIIHKFSWIKNREVITYSLGVFLLSLVTFHLLGRKSAWKV